MTDSVLGDRGMQRRLAGLRDRGLNFDLSALSSADPAQGWSITNVCQPLPRELPGEPEPDGTWVLARRLMAGYEFADPSIVRAYYDPAEPLEGRTMLLELKALALLRLHVGVRVGEVYDRSTRVDGRAVRIWGWNYRTLEGHVEQGQMDWEVWKWTEGGEIEFRVHSVSRPAPIPNLLIKVGFHLLRGHERTAFLNSTRRRMLEFTQLGREQDDPQAAIREASAEVTARPSSGDDAAHDEVARKAAQDR